MLSEFFTAIHDGFSSLHKRVSAVEAGTLSELNAVKMRLEALEKPFAGLTMDMVGKIHKAYGRSEQTPPPNVSPAGLTPPSETQ